MGSTHTNTLSPVIHTRLHNPKSFRHGFNIKFNSTNHRQMHNSLSHSLQLHFSQNPFPPQSPILCSCSPSSDHSNTGPSTNPQEKFSKFWVEKMVIFLVGSVIFLGCLNSKRVICLAGQKSSYGEVMEEKRDTRNGKLDDDEDMYVRLLEKNPRNVEALKVVVYGKMRKGKTKEAVEYVEKLIHVEPYEVEWKLLRAICYETMGHLSKAKGLFKEILEERPLLLKALHGLALVMHKKNEGLAVFEMLYNALEFARREKRVIEERNIKILIAQMHMVMGDLEESLKKFQDLGIVYSLLDKKEEAAEQFETYRSLVPEEFPQRGFLDDVVLSAKVKSVEQLQKEFESEYGK
ncbi:hypothetical protein RJ641_002616 [Dillenia turbinata]|uniref:Protein SLOW GREEN 1, chloroplastic n=1 Tax=Dillenia turbinata TaxID=194707 RepID=A0AAN8VNA5_9MAGN